MLSSKTGRVAAALALAGVLAAPAAIAQPGPADGTIRFHGGSLAFIGGIHWGGGVLYYHGRRYPIRVGGLTLGSIGGSSFDAVGRVYNLHNVRDIEGTYGAAHAEAVAVAGGGGVDMTNGNGVEIQAHSSNAGLQLTLAAQGVDIRLK